MPLYEYECGACGHRFEIIQKFSDGPPDACPKCGKGPLQRQQSSPAFQFKGTGWYVTDYAGRKSDPKADGDKAGGDVGDGAKTEAAAETKEAKPDDKSDAATPAKKTPKAKTPSKGAGAE